MVVSFDKLPEGCQYPIGRKQTKHFLESIAPDVVPRILRVHFGRNAKTIQEARIVGRGVHWEIRVNFWLENSKSRVLTRTRGWVHGVRYCGGIVSFKSNFVQWPGDSALRYAAFLLAHEVAHPIFWLRHGKERFPECGGGREEELWCDQWARRVLEKSNDGLLSGGWDTPPNNGIEQTIGGTQSSRQQALRTSTIMGVWSGSGAGPGVSGRGSTGARGVKGGHRPDRIRTVSVSDLRIGSEAGQRIRDHGLRVGGKPLLAYRRRQRDRKWTEHISEGWDEERVRRVIAHYEQQSEEEALAEDEAAFESSTQTFVEVPNELVPAVR